MTQQILEEGTYDFAARIVPQVLKANNWTCSEMVELKSWKDVLPNKVPPAALTVVDNYSLSQGLSDAVRIRNAAAHRQVCDNGELRRMARQARDLMVLYGDVRRRRKFEWLREELGAWDREGDGEAKRVQLEVSLLRDCSRSD